MPGSLTCTTAFRLGGMLDAAWDKSPDGMTGSFSLNNLDAELG